MSLVQWQPEYTLNIKIIDQQHQMLINIVNDIHEAFISNKEQQELAKLINKLSVYAAIHFAREEHLFDSYNYPHSDEHLKEHDYFEDTVSRFEEELETGKTDLSPSVLQFLSDWLTNHIEKSDQNYAPYLKSKGVA